MTLTLRIRKDSKMKPADAPDADIEKQPLTVGTLAKIVTFCVGLVVYTVVVFSYVNAAHTKTDANKVEIVGIKADLEKQGVIVTAMDKVGHPEHERRITALENKPIDLLVHTVGEQSQQISKLATIVQSDHDLIVRMMERMERRDAKP